MTSLAASTPLPQPNRGPLLIAGLGAVALLAVIGIAAPPLALHGWLIGFAFVGSAPLGALGLLLVHALTGGRWGEAHRPAMLTLARATPALIILVLPLVIGARAAYPWASDPAAAPADVAHLYLNAPAVGVRSIIGLGLLSWLVLRFGRARPGRLEAGLGLCLYALFMNAASYDWLLSLAPRFTSSAFGAQVMVGQILAALCCTVLLSNAAPDDSSWGDLGGLMLATTLGVGYLVLMGLAINWYGDLPEQARWYMTRSFRGWAWLEAGGALGAALSLLALLFGRVRGRPVPLRVVAVVILATLAIEYVWLVSPATEGLSALVGIVAAFACAALGLAASRAFAGFQTGARRGH